MNNMEVWESLRTPPKDVLKTIQAGRLKGMTDIKPQWRYMAMTEKFGPCGIGWKYTIDDQRIVDGVGDFKFAFADVSLFFKFENEWSEAIPGSGGSMLIAKESAGPHMNDEAFKMAITDALSVAMSRIGVAADIYMGQAAGSKYSSPNPSTNAKKTSPPPKRKEPGPSARTEKQLEIIFAKGAEQGLTPQDMTPMLKWKSGNKALSYEMASYIIQNFNAVCDEFAQFQNANETVGA